MTTKMKTTIRTRYMVRLDQDGKKWVCKVELVETREPNQHGFDCMIQCVDGIKSLAKKADLFRTRTEALAAP